LVHEQQRLCQRCVRSNSSGWLELGSALRSHRASQSKSPCAWRVGSLFTAGVSGVGVTGSAVFVSSSGQLGVRVSSVRVKDEIKPMDNSSEAILALKPVTFHYRKEIDPDRTPQFGLVAEEVEKVNRDLVTPDADGKTFTVRYDAVNAMLLSEFLKEHRQVQEQEKEIDALKAELKEQRTLIQKVSARLELQKAPAETVANIR
jgi:hypothetical protein